MSDSYNAGLARGIHDAQQVLDLENYSTMKQSVPDRMPNVVPLGPKERAAWLLGYGDGRQCGLIRAEIEAQFGPRTEPAEAVVRSQHMAHKSSAVYMLFWSCGCVNWCGYIPWPGQMPEPPACYHVTRSSVIRDIVRVAAAPPGLT
jgi:hypothetical protein